MNPFDYFGGLEQIGSSLMTLFILVTLCSVRIMVVMIVFPPTGDNVLQGVTRTAIVALWGGFVAFGQRGLMPRLHGLYLVEVAAKEAVVGLVIAFLASRVFWLAESVGAYIDDVTGYNHIQMVNPSQGQQTSLTSTLMSLCASMAFWTLGGMTFLLGAIFQSYRWLPVDRFTPVPAEIIASFALKQTDSLMISIAKLAAPAVMLLLLVDVGLALVARTAQKLDLMELSQPIKGGLAVLLLALLIGTFIEQVRDQLSLLHIADVLKAALGGH
ncbi:type III secretion system export apparatus subunit SctT [Trinickia dinghuensis]|uniref:EscT/YscT/HrcT family type III secretion system export apparatus protein n=1 Tax=Trinickia dinghuensis TaxID=2291023 RepID=A0A3D8JVJ0_9BURK|nr:type III secretion system export apparatus subunit SctT [Trinickia dinghuensis]RDU96745.1 EscT/YscT/HrcT family type III secretion system export apparatus protein [Trinickia dinghuensis]